MQNIYLFFDTETTGIPKNWRAPVTDVQNWPRMIQLAWLLKNDHQELLGSGNDIIRPEGFSIPADAAKVHGITTERALAEGVSLASVLDKFAEALQKANVLVAHNISFDEKIVGAEFIRNRAKDPLQGKSRVCTMLKSVDFCAIDGPYGFKWPKLEELHRKLFGVSFADAHDAMNDITATEKCFWELRKRGII